MFRVIGILVASLALEIAVCPYVAMSPAQRPEWYAAVMSCIAFLMCWGGVESSRWLLRKSPVARVKGPRSEWDKLWLWLGPTGGALAVVGLLVAWAVSPFLGAKMNTLVYGHFIAGPALWLVGAGWALKGLYTEGALAGLNGKLLGLGMATHLLAVAIMLWVYPGFALMGWQLAALSLVNLGAYYCFAFFYVMVAGAMWIPVFRLKNQDSAGE